MISMLRIIDDLSYYTYHSSTYDYSFTQVSMLCWNLTNTKWILPQLEPLYEKFDISYDQLLPSTTIDKTPIKFIELDGSANFAKRT